MSCIGGIGIGIGIGIGDCMNGGSCFKKQPGRASGSLIIPNSTIRLPNHRVVNACDPTRGFALSLFDDDLDLETKTIGYRDRTSMESPRVSEKLDEWIRNSVTEIVKNIKQAPLLIQIYADGEVKTKKALPEKDWKNVNKHRSSSIEGVILVEELRHPAVSGEEFEEDDRTRAFGVLIQGKSRGRNECKSTCYLLKTSSVNGGGLGHVCTHFCLMKVKSFHEDAFSQFNDCWLLQ